VTIKLFYDFGEKMSHLEAFEFGRKLRKN